MALWLLMPPSVPAQEEVALEPVVVTAPSTKEGSIDSALGASGRDKADLAVQQATTSDGARLLESVPGVSLYGAGGISSLPAIHGLADDRLRVQVDGADLTPACPNHMNSALSYVDPTRVASVTVFSGITPVSVGGDSIGGSIQVRSAPPEFASASDGFLARGEVGSFFRSNGDAYGYNLGATAALPWLNLTFSQSDSWSDNFRAGGDFKPVTPGREGGSPIPGDEVASSAYRGSRRSAVGLALRRLDHTLQLDLSQQTVDFEGFPNQRMDMTGNDNWVLNVRYTGQFTWGDLEARFSYQSTHHTMDMGPDRYFYGTGMPMNADAKTRGAAVKGNVILSERDVLRTGVEYQYYTLYDWWPAVGGSMGPNAFWNIDYGQRERFDAFAEWEARWNAKWISQVGVRSDTVMTNAGPVQGYNNALPAWEVDAAAFNGSQRQRIDYNWDLAALARYTPTPTQTFEGGCARKSRSPNLYQRYAWSTNAMTALMNNLVGDGNGYVGRIDLKPEVANTVSFTGDWHDAAGAWWGVKATAYYTYVQDYIDARRCDLGQCSTANLTTTTGFVLLQYINQSAQLYGGDLSGRLLFAKADAYGSFTGTGTMSYVRGENLSTGDSLYNIMPLNARLSLVHQFSTWTNIGEFQVVASKTHVSQVRNEIPTGGYFLINLRSSYEWKFVRVDVAVENLLNRLYSNPLGGAYVGQGPSMTTGGIPWGVAVPGMGRSFNVALSFHL